jgi:hypothetical protein
MATGTLGTTARQSHLQHVHYLRKSFTYLNDGQTLYVGTIPAGATLLIPISGVQVDVLFNGNATNTLDIGATTDSGTNDIATALALGTAGFIPIDVVTTPKTLTADTSISVLVTSTASASAGNGEIIICYIPDNDL